MIYQQQHFSFATLVFALQISIQQVLWAAKAGVARPEGAVP
jgi:hypothetical protein